jgi:hypothetical protein
MKRVLLLLDSDPVPNVYDVIVGYDGGADHIVTYGGITPGNVGPLIDGAVSPEDRAKRSIRQSSSAAETWQLERRYSRQ